MAIKLCRDLRQGMGLAEAKQYVENLEAGPLPTSTTSTVTTTGCLHVLVGLVFVAGCCFRNFLWSVLT